jgi:predicted RND superfamily exporter protein
VKRISDLIIRFRVPVIVATIAVTLALGYCIKDVRFNSDILGYLPKTDPAVKLNEHVGEVFGGTQLAVVALETGDVFTAACLDRIARLSADIGALDGVASVTSLANVIDIRKTADGLDVGRLIEPGAVPQTAEELAAFRAYVLSRDLYRGRLVSVDGTTTLVVARIEEGADKTAAAADIRHAVEGADLTERVYYAGVPFQLAEISRLMVRDMVYLIPAAALLIVLTLFASFRSIRGVLLPLVSVGISAVWVVGVMALLRVSFSLVTNVIPVVLMATGSAYGIHVVSAFNEATPSTDRVRDSQAALRSVVLPVTLAAVTTFAGFVSFVFGSYLGMIKEFGLFSALGVLFALLVSLTFVPAVLSYLPAQRPRVRAAARPAGRLASGVGRFVAKRHRAIIIVAAAIIALCAVGMPFMRRELDLLTYFAPGTDIRLSEAMMKQRFGGSITIQVLVRGDIREPGVLREMKSMEGFLREKPDLRNVNSIVEIVETMNDAITDVKAIPDRRDQVDNLWFLLEGDGQIAQMVNSDASEALISATIAGMNSQSLGALVRDVDGWAAAHTSTACSFELTGTGPIYQHLDSALVSSQLWSLLLATAFMFLCNLLMLRSVSGALVGLVPIIFTLFVLFGVMGVTGIPLDIATVLIGSISLGMGIDYSIHFLNRYRHELADGRPQVDALIETLGTTGKAILINVATVSIGFVALAFGGLIPLRRFGLLIPVTMVSSGLAALTLLPAVMFLVPSGATRRAFIRIRAAATALRRKLSRVKVKIEEDDR